MHTNTIGVSSPVLGRSALSLSLRTFGHLIEVH